MSNTKIFYQALGNTLISTVTNMTVWFALTYFAFLETQSVFTTGIVAGIYLVVVAGSGFWLGSLVDHYKKKQVMQMANFVSLALYTLAFTLYLLAPEGAFKDPASIWLWSFIVTLLFGVIAGNIRTIALPTLVTILIPEDKRDKINGLSGAASGAAFLVVSIISGLLMGFGGMQTVMIIALIMTIATILHLTTITIPEKGIVHTGDDHKKIDLKGTFAIVAAVPGLLALILFTTFNNFLGGVFMALLDAYGLSLVSVQIWGILWGVISVAFIVGGLVVSKKGLGKNPVRTLFLANLVMWVFAAVFTLQSWVWLLTIGMFMYLLLAPVIEASEQTILQRVVPANRQGRVFGFAQSVEQAASPLTAFLIGPIAQFIFIPYMTNGAGVDLIGGWFGTGADRGLALLFTLTGIIGFICTLLAMNTKYFRQLSERYLKSAPKDDAPKAPLVPAPAGEQAGITK